MLPIYEALEFKEVVQQGGTTFPWFVVLLVKHQPVPYIVKVFKRKNVEEQHSVTKEVYGNIFAKEFDLYTPDACLVEFTDEFIDNLPEPIAEILKDKDERLKFGVKYIEGAQMYLPSSHNNIIDRESKALIYGFDNLALNTDRHANKPNILMYNHNSFALIDHELTFLVSKAIMNAFGSQNWIYNYKRHIFYHDLKKVRDKDSLFETVGEYIKSMNVNVLDSYAQQLREVGHDDGNIDLIKEYLTLIKENRGNFINILKATLETK